MPRELAIGGTHDRVLDVLKASVGPKPGARVLDIGAGEGALSSRLKDAGLSVSACDATPDLFCAPGVECRACDDSGVLPFSDRSFDLALAVEVLEHIDGHSQLFAEVARILEPDGCFIFTTPNILSLKSRVRFLLTGCHYSFDPLTPFVKDVVHQHISPFTLNRYAWMLSQHGFRVDHVTTDKMQTSSRFLSFLTPCVKLAVRSRFGKSSWARAQNSPVALYGRKLVIVARPR